MSFWLGVSGALGEVDRHRTGRGCGECMTHPGELEGRLETPAAASLPSAADRAMNCSSTSMLAMQPNVSVPAAAGVVLVRRR
jgi:hypothetical protein